MLLHASYADILLAHHTLLRRRLHLYTRSKGYLTVVRNPNLFPDQLCRSFMSSFEGKNDPAIKLVVRKLEK